MWVHTTAPDGATIDLSTRSYRTGAREVGLWALYLPVSLSALAGWYATVGLARKNLGWRRYSWIVLCAVGPAIFFALMAYDALS